MGAIRVVAGLALAGIAAAYYGIAMLFILGDAADPGYARAFGIFGMLGICAPVVLCGLHLAFFGNSPPLWARALMAGAVALSLVATTLAMLPHALARPPNPEADNVILGAAVMSGLFGWPILRGLFHALMARHD